MYNSFHLHLLHKDFITICGSIRHSHRFCSPVHLVVTSFCPRYLLPAPYVVYFSSLYRFFSSCSLRFPVLLLCLNLSFTLFFPCLQTPSIANVTLLRFKRPFIGAHIPRNTCILYSATFFSPTTSGRHTAVTPSSTEAGETIKFL